MSEPEARRDARRAPLSAERRGRSGRDPSFTLDQWSATIRGVETVFLDHGAGDPVVFVHGLAGNLTHWRYVAPEFSATHRVIGLDLPGCGASAPLPASTTVGHYATHVLALLDFLELDRVTLVGHSLGGMVSTRLAARHPERVSGLVLVNPAGFQPMPAVVAAASRAALHRGVLKAVLPRFWKQLLGHVFQDHNERTEAFVRSVDETHADEDIHGIAAVIAALRPDFVEADYTSLLAGLPMPLGMIWGDRDRLIAPKVLARAVASRRDAMVEVLAGVGHMPIIERPAPVVALVRRVLEA